MIFFYYVSVESCEQIEKLFQVAFARFMYVDTFVSRHM